MPGLLRLIVNFLFNAAGQAIGFLAERAWLPILAVVAFLIETYIRKWRLWNDKNIKPATATPFCLHCKSCCQSQLLASVLLFALLELILWFEAGESDFLFRLQALDLFGVLLLLCELDWKGGCLVGSLSILPPPLLVIR